MKNPLKRKRWNVVQVNERTGERKVIDSYFLKFDADGRAINLLSHYLHNHYITRQGFWLDYDFVVERA